MLVIVCIDGAYLFRWTKQKLTPLKSRLHKIDGQKKDGLMKVSNVDLCYPNTLNYSLLSHASQDLNLCATSTAPV